MSSILQFVVLVAIIFGDVDAKPPSRIVGGEPAVVAELPYQVSLRKYGRHRCGGTIISNRHILTAAHCLRGRTAVLKRYLSVMVGSNSIDDGTGVIKTVDSVTVHPDYSSRFDHSMEHDIAVISLNELIEFNVFTRAAELPVNDTAANLNCVASGWGDTIYMRSEQTIEVRKAEMTTITNDDCFNNWPRLRIQDGHLCASAPLGTGACSGDSGGPLFCNNEVVGVASYVVPCGQGIPDVFTRVHFYLDFIRTAMAFT